MLCFGCNIRFMPPERGIMFPLCLSRSLSRAPHAVRAGESIPQPTWTLPQGGRVHSRAQGGQATQHFRILVTILALQKFDLIDCVQAYLLILVSLTTALPCTIFMIYDVEVYRDLETQIRLTCPANSCITLHCRIIPKLAFQSHTYESTYATFYESCLCCISDLE